MQRNHNSEKFLDAVLKKSRENEKELHTERARRDGLEAQVNGLKEACFYQTFHSRKTKILTKFLPVNDVIRNGVGLAAKPFFQHTGEGSKSVLENMTKLHREMLAKADSDSTVRSLVPLSTKLKLGVDTLCKNNEKLEDQCSALVDLLKMRASESIPNNNNISQSRSTTKEFDVLSTVSPRLSRSRNATPRGDASARSVVAPPFQISPLKASGFS